MTSAIPHGLPSVNEDLLSASELPPGFKWSGGSAIYDFVVNNIQLRLTVPIPSKEDAKKLLAPFDKDKIEFLGEVAIAAGVGKDNVAVSFKRNEAGEFTEAARHLKDGNTQPLNTKYFRDKEKEIKEQNLPQDQEKVRLDSLNCLKWSLKTVDSIFKTCAFKGLSITDQKTESRRINATPTIPKSVQITPLD